MKKRMWIAILVIVLSIPVVRSEDSVFSIFCRDNPNGTSVGLISVGVEARNIIALGPAWGNAGRDIISLLGFAGGNAGRDIRAVVGLAGGKAERDIFSIVGLAGGNAGRDIFSFFGIIGGKAERDIKAILGFAGGVCPGKIKGGLLALKYEKGEVRLSAFLVPI